MRKASLIKNENNVEIHMGKKGLYKERQIIRRSNRWIQY